MEIALVDEGMELLPLAGGAQMAAGLEEEWEGEFVRTGSSGMVLQMEEEEEGLGWVGTSGIGSEQGVGEVGIGVREGIEDGAGVGDVSFVGKGSKGEEFAQGNAGGSVIVSCFHEVSVELHGLANAGDFHL